MKDPATKSELFIYILFCAFIVWLVSTLLLPEDPRVEQVIEQEAQTEQHRWWERIE